MNNITENIAIMNDNSKCFTRYLYPKEQVCHSLFLAILGKQVNEALFWGYEMYFSGFQAETINFIYYIFEEIFMSSNNDNFCAFIQKKYDDWFDNITRDDILGIIIWNLAIRPYNISHFLETYFSVKCKILDEQSNNKFIRINSFDVTPYKTIELEKGKAWNLLRQVCHFSIRSECIELFKGTIFENDDLWFHWLYYASNSPVWKERITKYNGSIDHETKNVYFHDDDCMEEFYGLFGLEPDEQPREIQLQCIGKKEQLSIVDFSKKYGGNMIIKIKPKNIKELVQSDTSNTLLMT